MGHVTVKLSMPPLFGGFAIHRLGLDTPCLLTKFNNNSLSHSTYMIGAAKI